MAVRALIFGTDDLFPKLKPFYDREVEKGNLEIIGYAVFKDNKIYLLKNLQGEGLNVVSFDKMIISSRNNFIVRLKMANIIFNKNFHINKNISIDNVIDGRVFQIQNFDLIQFCDQGMIKSTIPNTNVHGNVTNFRDSTNVIYQRIYNSKKVEIALGMKSYVASSKIEGLGWIQIGNFSSLGWDIIFQLGLTNDHYYQNVTSYGIFRLDWVVPDFYIQDESFGFIKIGSDVWIGRGCRFKTSNPNKPLIIGNGAVIASDSVVIKDVPPYAIVGGNPAKFIKWRFPQEIIEGLEKIQWWNWDLEKIYDNFQLFKNPEEFVKKFS
ncbi:MAG: CatB-related O-acetyltransferase [Selenomonadaceae bacterium]|nr:CatB-related O-acetyltransferase [Selenomonadaceae bacterium]